MSIINLNEYKAQKARDAIALQYAKAYGVDINKVVAGMGNTNATVVRRIKVEDVMETLGLSTLDIRTDGIIEWDNNIPW